MPVRDYEHEFREYVRARVPEDDYIAAIVAKDIITEMEAEDPDLLRGWLDLRKGNFVTEYVQRMSVGTRSPVRFRNPRALFQQAAEEFAETRDARVLKVFEAEYVVNEQNVRRRVRDLTADDCAYIADSYRRSAQTALLEAAFFRQLKRRLGRGNTVADIFTPEEYDRMRHGFMKSKYSDGPE